jgi:hypothetical protein
MQIDEQARASARALMCIMRTDVAQSLLNRRRNYFGTKEDGTYVIEFRTADGEALAISIPTSEAGVIRHFQERMPTGYSCRRSGSNSHPARVI